MSEFFSTRSIPAEFRQALEANGLLKFFTECAYVHRAGYLSWVKEPSRRPTRRTRILRAVAQLREQQERETRAAQRTFGSSAHGTGPAELRKIA